MTGAVPPACRQVQELLPWRDDASLTDSERASLEEHLEVCSLCRRELEVWTLISTGVRSAARAAPTPHPAALQVLLQRREDPVIQPPPSSLRAAPSRWTWLAAAVVVAGVTVLGLTLTERRLTQQPMVFRTLSQEEAPRSPARLRVVFESAVALPAMHELLIATEARVVDGPSPYGVWSLEAVDVEAALVELRASPLVRFVELQEPRP